MGTTVRLFFGLDGLGGFALPLLLLFGGVDGFLYNQFLEYLTL